MKRLFPVALLLLTACSGQEKESEFIPDIQVECTAAQVADCAGTGLEIFIGLVSTIPGDCDDYLSGLNASARQTSFDAHGTTVSGTSGIYLTGTVSDWKNSLGASADVLNPGPYWVCGWIDANANGLIDTNEPVAKDAVTPGQTGFVLSTWTRAFN